MENLKILRLNHKLSQQKLAEQLGITQQAIYNYENHLTEPDIHMLIQLADFFHTSVDYLIGHSSNPFLYEDAQLLSKSENSQGDLQHMIMYKKLSNSMQEHIDSIIKELIT